MQPSNSSCIIGGTGNSAKQAASLADPNQPLSHPSPSMVLKVPSTSLSTVRTSPAVWKNWELGPD